VDGLGASASAAVAGSPGYMDVEGIVYGFGDVDKDEDD
jgi:hypothetical protein